MKGRFLPSALAAAALAASCGLQAQENRNYADGVFMLNEDWFGHNNSTLNFIHPDNTVDPFEYYVIQNNEANAGQSLGATAQFGTVYADRLFVVSKQDQDAGSGLSPGEQGETRQGGRIVVADAHTMEILARIPVIMANDKGVSIADGRGFVGVDETKGYVGTSNGIYVLRFSPFEITGCIHGTENTLVEGGEDKADDTGPLYQNQIGMMLRTPAYVFAIQQDKGILAIDPQADTIVHVIPGCFSTMAMSRDGDIWAGRNTNPDYQHYPYGEMGSSGECWQGDELTRIDPETFETESVRITQGGINQTWYAWNAGSLCASAKENALYFTFNENRWSWFTTSKLYKFDIDTRTFSLIYDSSTDKRYFYGAGIRVSPADDRIYAALYLDNVVQSYWVYQMDHTGKVLKEWEPIDRYWFPALFIFPDNHGPEAGEFENVVLDGGEKAIDLSTMATDEDNMEAAIVKTVVGNTHPDVAEAGIKGNKLTLIPCKAGETDITVRFNSNGKCVERTLHVRSTGTGIHNMRSAKLHIWAGDGRIYVEGLQKPAAATVHDLAGRLEYAGTLSPGESIGSLPSGQCHIVSISGEQYKIFINH